MQDRKCGNCGFTFSENALRKVKRQKYGYAYICRECFDIVNGIDYKNFTDSENKLIDKAVETVKQKYLEQGGKEADMESDDYIDNFFCDMIYYQGKGFVRKFVKNYTYNPSQRRQPVYYQSKEKYI